VALSVALSLAARYSFSVSITTPILPQRIIGLIIFNKTEQRQAELQIFRLVLGANVSLVISVVSAPNQTVASVCSTSTYRRRSL